MHENQDFLLPLSRPARVDILDSLTPLRSIEERDGLQTGKGNKNGTGKGRGNGKGKGKNSNSDAADPAEAEAAAAAAGAEAAASAAPAEDQQQNNAAAAAAAQQKNQKEGKSGRAEKAQPGGRCLTGRPCLWLHLHRTAKKTGRPETPYTSSNTPLPRDPSLPNTNAQTPTRSPRETRHTLILNLTSPTLTTLPTEPSKLNTHSLKPNKGGNTTITRHIQGPMAKGFL